MESKKEAIAIGTPSLPKNFIPFLGKFAWHHREKFDIHSLIVLSTDLQSGHGHIYALFRRRGWFVWNLCKFESPPVRSPGFSPESRNQKVLPPDYKRHTTCSKGSLSLVLSKENPVLSLGTPILGYPRSCPLLRYRFDQEYLLATA